MSRTPAAEEPTLSVSELNAAIAEAVQLSFRDSVWVRGEIQQYHVSRNGHSYFELVEKADHADRVQARLPVALFRNDRPGVNRTLREVPGVRLGDGVEVRIRARVDFYPPTGRLQLVMSGIDPVFTIGRMAADRDRLLRVLAGEDLLRANARCPVPDVPLRVGLVASGGSAAYRDFVHELEASRFAFRVGLVDVRVQGAAANRRIAYGLRKLAALDVDVVVVVRGGGARSDLAPFDSELVARTIAAMPVPVLTGIGHEVDRTVADEVAAAAYKTPTACAAALVERVADFDDRLARVAHRIGTRARVAIADGHHDLRDAAGRVTRSVPGALARERRLADGIARRVAHSAPRLLGRERAGVTAHERVTREHAGRALRREDARLSVHVRTLGTSALRVARVASARLDADAAMVRALDPRRVLERGYTISRAADGGIVTRASGVEPGAMLRTEFADGSVTSRVDTVDVTGAEP